MIAALPSTSTPISDSDLRAIAGVFSTRVFRALGREYPTPPIMRLDSLKRMDISAETMTLGQALDEAHSHLSSCRQIEYVYKNHLVQQVVLARHRPDEASVLVELRAGRSVADLVVFNGSSTAYEIKTEFDSYARLQGQLDDYSARFEFVNLVVHERMVDSAISQIDDRVGLMSLGDCGQIVECRPAASGAHLLNPIAIYGTLRQAEVLRILERTLYYRPDTTPANQWERLRDLYSTLDADIAHREAVKELKRRGEALSQIAHEMPYSLGALTCATNQSRTAATRIQSRLARPVKDAIPFDT